MGSQDWEVDILGDHYSVQHRVVKEDLIPEATNPNIHRRQVGNIHEQKRPRNGGKEGKQTIPKAFKF